mgnify:FL=1
MIRQLHVSVSESCPICAGVVHRKRNPLCENAGKKERLACGCDCGIHLLDLLAIQMKCEYLSDLRFLSSSISTWRKSWTD